MLRSTLDLRVLACFGLCFSCLSCTSDAPPAADTSISFMPPDAASDADAAADAADTAPPSVVGMACTVDEDCPAAAPICLVGDGFRDGHCTEFCAGDAADTCPAGSHCTPIGFMRDVCLAECDPRAERPCRQGYGCGPGGPVAAVCAPGCDVDDDCPEGLSCNPDDGGLHEGECFDPEAENFDPCTEPEDCPSDSWCIRERDRGYPGGACTIFRCNEIDDTGCPGDAHCVFDFYRDPICIDGCVVDADCRDGYACLPDETYPDRVRCTPACTDDAHCLEPGFSCDVMTSRCV